MDLSTTYLGLPLEHPVVASAGPLTSSVDQVVALADGGVSAVVLHSMFEEVLRREAAQDIALADQYSQVDAESGSYFPLSSVIRQESGLSHLYLSLLERAVGKVSVPVIASINGSTAGGWVEFSRQMQDAGAAAIELNVYMVPGNVDTRGSLVEERHLDIVRGVRDAVSIPVAVKLSPYFSSVGDLAVRLDEAGADGLVLFNRFLTPDIDVEQVSVVPQLRLSSPAEAGLPRTWIAALRGRVACDLAASTGVESPDDVVKYLLAGADVVMTTSALVRHGCGYAGELVSGLQSWMESHSYRHIDEVRGMLAIPAQTDSTRMLRSGYVAAIERARQTYGDLTH